MPDPTQNNTDPQNTNQNPQPTGTPSSDQTSPITPDFLAVDSSTADITNPVQQPQETATPPTDTLVPDVTQKAEEKVDDTKDQGSSSPMDLPPTSSAPKKKFGGGKIIATILGFLVLAGGIVGGVILTQQQQDIREKAVGDECTNNAQCGSGYKCSAGICVPESGGGMSGSYGGNNNNDDEDDAGTTTTPQCTSGQTKTEACTTSSGCTAGVKTIYCTSGKWGTPTDGIANESGCIAPAGLCQESCNPNTQTWSASKSKCVDNNSPDAGCSVETDCANGYVCDPATKACVAGGVAVGGAPVNCTRDCAAGNYVCENPGQRLECKTKDYLNNEKWCLIEANSDQCGAGSTISTTTTTTTDSASCQNIKAYSPTWTQLTADNLKGLKEGDQVNFCVAGSTTAGTFDKAKFTINTVAQAETTTKRPSSSDFCQLYTIPAATTSFSITAQIHHATLGWK